MRETEGKQRDFFWCKFKTLFLSFKKILSRFTIGEWQSVQQNLNKQADWSCVVERVVATVTTKERHEREHYLAVP